MVSGPVLALTLSHGKAEYGPKAAPKTPKTAFCLLCNLAGATPPHLVSSPSYSGHILILSFPYEVSNLSDLALNTKPEPGAISSKPVVVIACLLLAIVNALHYCQKTREHLRQYAVLCCGSFGLRRLYPRPTVSHRRFRPHLQA